MRAPDYFDMQDAEDLGERRPDPRCRRCGSDAVRWRQQGGRWVLFSLRPGIEHQCDVTDDFDDITQED